jgi:hypothetical protein
MHLSHQTSPVSPVFFFLQGGLEAPPPEERPEQGESQDAEDLAGIPVSVQWPHQHADNSPERTPSVHAGSSDCASISALPVSTNFSAAALYQDTAFAEAAPDTLLQPPAQDAASPAPYERPAHVGPLGWGFSPSPFAARTVSADAILPEHAYGQHSSASEQSQLGPSHLQSTSANILHRHSPSHVCLLGLGRFLCHARFPCDN